MRNLVKSEEPEILKQNKALWLQEFLKDKTNATSKYRYRHKEIKGSLVQETSGKCVYCESKIGHNTPGDVEHKIPSSKEEILHFEWSNLTIACTECNRRKNDHYEIGNEFLDPYSDDVESMLEHLGPIVSWRCGDARGEITVRTLELNSHNRYALICRKIEKIEEFNNMVERYKSQKNTVLKELLRKRLEEMKDKSSEYSAMIMAVANSKRSAASPQIQIARTATVR